MFQRRVRHESHVATGSNVVSETGSKGAFRHAAAFSFNRILRHAKFLACMVILLVWCVVLNIESSTRIDPRDTVVASDRNKNAIDAIVTIAAKGFGSAMLLSSLVNVGLWGGPIYVFTDGLAKQVEVARQFNATLVDIRGNHPTFLSKGELQEYSHYLDTVNRDMWVKWHKTQIFELLPDVQTVLYVDADIKLQRPIEDFFRDLQPLLRQDDCEIFLYGERWYRNLRVRKLRYEETGKYNSGIMVLNRKKSRNILQRWSSTLVKAPFAKRDQPKLTASIEMTKAKVCLLPKRLSHVLFEPDITDRLMNRWWRVRTFRHMTSRKNVKQTWNATFEGDP